MKHSWRSKAVLFAGTVLLAGSVFFPKGACGGACSDGVAIPPFLAAGVDSNLLLLIDNSASMYDMAYVDDQTYCFDESFDPTAGYAGYFEPATWYNYDLGVGQFESKTAAEAAAICAAAAGTKYDNSDVCVVIDATPATPVVRAFTATGNFLNWATASKLDVEKKILTGGKYDSVNGRIVMETRGCAERRFAKQVVVTDAGGSPFKLALGILPKDLDAGDNTTQIEIFNVTADGFDPTGACQDLVTELNTGGANLGTLMNLTDECMSYDEHINDAQASFNHSLQTCWYIDEHAVPPPYGLDPGDVQRIMNSCSNVYLDIWVNHGGQVPEDITTDHPAYVCYGFYSAAPGLTKGYVGRCWDPDVAVLGPSGNNWTTEGWIAGAGADGGCIEQALFDYCGDLDVPPVVDPTDQAADGTGKFWNIPAVLVDSGMIGWLGEPLVVLNGYIAQAAAPSGLIQEFAGDLRMGAMVFNDDGSKSEPDLSLIPDPASLDGGKVISYIDKSALHTTDLVNAINDIKATSWTPIAEAMYNAVGYFTQNSSLRLDGNDFLMDAAHPDPVEAWCQNNSILIITDGASSADQNSDVSTFIATAGQNDGDAEIGACAALSGSTFLDDLTYYAKEGDGIYPVEQWEEVIDGVKVKSKQNITTHIVIAGELRDTGAADECNPAVLLQEAADNAGTALYQAAVPSDLEDALREAFAAIRAGVSAGSAASVISASRGGEGAVYQAIFWPEVEVAAGDPVKWIGEVHALFVDEYGNIYEDTNDNRTLDVGTGDEQVIIYFDEAANTTKACYGTLNADGSCNGTSKDLDQIHYLWSAVEWLANISDANIVTNRDPYISPNSKRYIFTWNDLDNDGIVDGGEVLDFETEADWLAAPFTVAASRGPVPLDFGVRTTAEVNAIINWVRGLDQAGMRGRQLKTDFNLDGFLSTVTWRLGDVIHSTPMAVARPSEGFHLLYRDFSYAQFATQYNNRRHVIYFGGNDGMFHAVNGGFYDKTQKKFCKTADCLAEGAAPELGAELWAYVPYNLLAHLKCLTNSGYEHKYFVDQRPRIFDMQIFSDDADHPNGWGTVLVGVMGFGGAKVLPGGLDLDGDLAADYPADTRVFTSAYFVFDITNPEKPPVLLGELTMTNTGLEPDFGYTTVIPTAVPMKDGASKKWYLVWGSGPTELDAESTQTAKLGVLPLEWLTGAVPKPFRIPDALPAVGNEGGRFELANGFVSDIISVDFDLEEDYKADVLYFGTVEGTWGSWGGRLYRLVTQKKVAGVQVETKPSEWSSLLSAGGLTNPLPLINVNQPVTAAPSVGTDGKNYWVYFGTGRFFDPDDKTDASQQTYYGIKEPQAWALEGGECVASFTWQTVSNIDVTPATHDTTPGSQGLLQVDQILVGEASLAFNSVLSCIDGTTDCLPLVGGVNIDHFDQLISYIAGSTGNGCEAGHSNGTDGWYKEFLLDRERNLGQAALLGGLLTFTTYQPFDDVCLPEGLSFLYGVYYQTGTPWYEIVFENHITEHVSLGRGLALTPNIHVGKQEGSKAFVQTSTGAIVEIPQLNLPVKNVKSGRANWLQISQ